MAGEAAAEIVVFDLDDLEAGLVVGQVAYADKMFDLAVMLGVGVGDGELGQPVEQPGDEDLLGVGVLALTGEGHGEGAGEIAAGMEFGELAAFRRVLEDG